MPICPDCHTTIEYKNGLVCHACHFDFKLYPLVSWKLLHFKFHPEQRTVRQWVQITFWLIVPSLLSTGLTVVILAYISPLVTAIYALLFVLPIVIFFTIRPVAALLREDKRV